MIVCRVAVLLGQRVLEHVAVECAVYVGVRVLRAYTSEDSLLKLVKVSWGGSATLCSAATQPCKGCMQERYWTPTVCADGGRH